MTPELPVRAAMWPVCTVSLFPAFPGPRHHVLCPRQKPHGYRLPMPASSDSAQGALPCPSMQLVDSQRSRHHIRSQRSRHHIRPDVRPRRWIDSGLSSLSWSGSVHCQCCHVWPRNGSSQSFLSHVPVTPHPAAGRVRSSDFP